MSLATILAMISLSFVMSISPGPVNIMIISSGINKGFKRTFLFISGATIGFTLLLVFIAFGFSTVLLDYPLFLDYLSVFGAIFIIYMGYKIASSSTNIKLEINNTNLKFYEGFLLQWLNPKAWVACVSGVSMFSSSKTSLLVFVIIYFLVCYLSLCFWGLLGQKATIFLNTNLRLKIFNILMGSILIILAISLIVINIF